MGWLTHRLGEPRSPSGPLVLPGAYDAYSALLVQAAGFEGVYCGGYATAASGFGLPDLGLLGLADVIGVYRRVAAAVDVPVVADVDTGYGGPLSVARTVRELARAGVAALQIEDQVHPKRCGHLQGKEVVDLREAVARVLAAVRVAEPLEVDIVARTDVLATEGMDAAVARARIFLECGAAAVLVDAASSENEVAELRDRIPGPMVHNAVDTGTGPVLTTDRLAALGYDLIIQPVGPLLAAHHAVTTYLAALRNSGSVADPGVLFDASGHLLGTTAHLSWDAHTVHQADRVLADQRPDSCPDRSTRPSPDEGAPL